jgi:hypothetical protein
MALFKTPTSTRPHHATTRKSGPGGLDEQETNTVVPHRSVAAAPCLPSLDHHLVERVSGAADKTPGLTLIAMRWLVGFQMKSFSKLSCLSLHDKCSSDSYCVSAMFGSSFKFHVAFLAADQPQSTPESTQ